MTEEGLPLRELILCSLEPWDEIWRRNQFLVDGLLRRQSSLRVLFVEPPADILFDLASHRTPQLPRWRTIGYGGRLRVFRPLKILPRRVGGGATDGALELQVVAAARATRLANPLVWINDVTYAPLIARMQWPSLYDVTDDWLLAPLPRREIERLRELDKLALSDADTVVVCSLSLAESRGRAREVRLIRNAVDIDHFRRRRVRPTDLPHPPTAVYAGTLHESRLDVDLVLELGREIPNLNIVLVGPSSLEKDSVARLRSQPNIHVLGSRPYEAVPGYLQHADVIVVPHVVTPFTDSLDPIKAYECLAVDRPTVATPVAGFRELSDWITVVDRDNFASSVAQELKPKSSPPDAPAPIQDVPTWDQRVDEITIALASSLGRHRSATAGRGMSNTGL